MDFSEILEASAYYQAKYIKRPDVIICRQDDEVARMTHVAGMRVLVSKQLRPDEMLIGYMIPVRIKT